PALGRRAAAGRGGSGADEPAGPAAGRRADRGSGQPLRRAGHGPADRPQPDRADTAAGHARPTPGHPLRQPAGRPGGRADRTGAPAGADAVSAVWRAAKAAVQRRRLQTFIISVVVFFSTAMIVV